MIELGLGTVADIALRGIGHVFLGILDRLRETTGVEFDEVDGRLGEHGEP